MNKKLLAATLPLLGGAIIVGAGFSAWAFEGDQTFTQDISGQVVVTDLLEGVSAKLVAEISNDGGTTTIKREVTSFNLELDQGVLFDTNTLTIGVNPYMTLSNVRYDIINVAVQVYYTGTNPTLSDLLTDHDLTLENFSLAYKTPGTNESAHAVETYVDMSSTTKTAISQLGGTEANSYKTTFTNESRPGTLTSDIPNEASTYLIYKSAYVAFDWVWNSSQKPGNNSAYSAMNSAITADSTFVLTLSLDGAWSTPTV